jgi:DegV family protein with EDD domain
MTERVAVVTDSTADVPVALLPVGLRVVPLPVRIGSRSGFDGVDIGAEDVAAALRAHVQVTTSRPTPSAFEAAYRAAFAEGADRVVSVHISAELSGTWDSARLAAQEFDYGAVRVVDSRSTAMGLGFAVLAAARAAADGAGAGAVQDAAVSTVDRTSCFFYVDTLEYLRLGGRIGAAQAFVGTALSVKPLLHMRDGRVVPLEKVRTAAKAIARLLDIVALAAGDDEVDVAVQHLAAPERAEQVSTALRERLPRLGRLITSEVAATVGVHTGPGTVGVVVCRR